MRVASNDTWKEINLAVVCCSCDVTERHCDVTQCIVHCEMLSELTLKGYLFLWNQVSKVYKWRNLGMENMLPIQFGCKPGVTNCTITDKLSQTKTFLNMPHFATIIAMCLWMNYCGHVFQLYTMYGRGGSRIFVGEGRRSWGCCFGYWGTLSTWRVLSWTKRCLLCQKGFSTGGRGPVSV